MSSTIRSVNTANPTTRGFHGWYVVAAAFTLTFIGFGCAYTFGSFIPPLEQAFGVTRSTVSLVFSFAGFLYFALGAATGPLSDRIGARPLIAVGVVLMGGGLCAASLATGAAGALGGYALGIGLGLGCVYVPAVGVVQHWFARHRGLASGLAVSGIGVGTLVFPPLAHWMIVTIGWRHAYLVLGLVTLALGGLATIAIRDDPAQLGQFPDGDAAPPEQVVATGLTPGQAIRSRAFAHLYAAMLLIGIGAFVPFVHLIPAAIDRGASAGRAALLIALIGIGSTAGRFLLGGWADRIGRETAFTVMCVGMGLSTAWWAVAPAYWALVVFALAFGLFYGGWVALAPALVADLFGRRHASAIIGILFTSVAIGTLIGPYGAGLIYDATGSYLPAIAASAVLALCGAAAAKPLAGLRPELTGKNLTLETRPDA